MGVLSTKCTNCGADLKLDDSRELAFCQYCGHKMIISSLQKTEHTTVIRNEAEIIRATTEARELELAEKRRKSEIRAQWIPKLIKYTWLPIAILIYIFIRSITGNNYKLVNSTAYTEKAFNVTTTQLIERFIKQDTRVVADYGLLHTDWKPIDGDEEYFISSYNSLYHGEHRYKCFFYKPSDNKAEPDSIDDKRVLFYLFAETDDQDRIVYLSLTTMFRDETLAGEKTLNVYFGTTLRGELFSILSGQKGDYVLKKFKEAENSWFGTYTYDKDVRYYYKGYSNAKDYIMNIHK